MLDLGRLHYPPSSPSVCRLALLVSLYGNCHTDLFLHVFLALFQVLGVHPLAGADEVSAAACAVAVAEPASHNALCWAPLPQFSRARSRKVTAAGDDAAAVAKVEAAYEAIMMRQLALRMKGQGPIGGIGVSKEVAFADKAVRKCSTP